MIDVVPTLKAAIAELEASLRANPDPRVRKLQRLRETLAEYEPVGSRLPQPMEIPPILEPLPAASGAGAATKPPRMRAHIDGVLRKTPKVHRKSLLEGLLAAGIMGKELNPMQALAIFLSGNKETYESDGEGNYSLRKGGAYKRFGPRRGSGVTRYSTVGSAYPG